MADLYPEMVEPMEPVFEEEELPPATQPPTEELLVARESENAQSPVETCKNLELTTGTVALSQNPFVLEFCNDKDKKLVLRQQEITALMCLLPEAKEQMQALHRANAEGARFTDGVRWTKPISSGKNYKVDIEAGVYKTYAYLVIQPFFRQSAMATPSEKNVAEPGNDGRIVQYFQQLRKKKEEASEASVWLRTASNFKLKTKEIDELIGFVIDNMY